MIIKIIQFQLRLLSDAAGNTKIFCDPSSSKKYFPALRIYKFIKSSVNPFVDISFLTSPD